MKATMFRRAIFLLSTLAFVAMMGFAQDQQSDDRKKLAREVGLELTDTMTTALDLTIGQKDSVTQCNLTYTLALFTTDPLTEEAIKTLDSDLDECLKDILTAPQYDLWLVNREKWLDDVKKNLLPKEEEFPIIPESPNFN